MTKQPYFYTEDSIDEATTTTTIIPKSIIDALDQRNYQSAINEASSAISALFERHYIALLDKRSYAHAMQCNFKAALKDAYEMIKYAPTSSKGYLRAGRLYAMEGKQTQAIQICQRGIETVSPWMDPRGYRLLKEHKVLAEYQNAKRIDFIARLPLETAFTIFMQLDRGEKGIALAVSKTWRERLLLCSPAWNKLTSTGCKPDMMIAKAIDRIGPHVQTLLLACKTNTLRNLYLNHIKDGTFANLKTLILTRLMTTVLHREQIIIALWQVRHTLTKLAVDFSGNQTTVTFGSILFACPQLIDLSYITSENLQLHLGDLTTIKKPCAIRQLHVKSKLSRSEDIRPILQRCPQLRYLAIEGCPHAILDSVFEQCPCLEVVGYHAATSTRLPSLTCDECERETTGLRILHISACVDPHHIIPIIHKNGKALENLLLYLSTPTPVAAAAAAPPPPADIINNDNNDDHLNDAYDENHRPNHHDDNHNNPMIPYQKITLQHLRNFACSFESNTQEKIIENVINVSPELRTVSLMGVENLNTMAEALCSLTRLEALSIGGGIRAVVDSNNALKTFFKKHAKLGPHSPLRMIRFMGCGALKDDVFNAILSTQTLEVVKIDYCQKISSDGLRMFVSMLGSLEALTLGLMEKVTDTVVEHISPSIREVCLQGLPNITDRGVMKFIDTSSVFSLSSA
ncbi:hypothetical protein BDA99DRAFT_183402 [Phascolomyces articulosus]|uniref:F-box domain-containing protein n=1 Tax=Phascolomyces articulosus TaxID=60185 RepID=A0AAD5PBN7_9FUNG|nr:hypothetical protein BDA99DRAFT_183402 [Phascolomyces articulosus]